MPTFTVVEAAAGSAIGTDLLTNGPPNIKRSEKLRAVKKLGLTGSAAAGDAAIDLYYGSNFVGRFFNTTAGANIVPLEARDFVRLETDLMLDPNEDLLATVVDAGATNVLRLTLVIDDIDLSE